MFLFGTFRSAILPTGCFLFLIKNFQVPFLDQSCLTHFFSKIFLFRNKSVNSVAKKSVLFLVYDIYSGSISTYDMQIFKGLVEFSKSLALQILPKQTSMFLGPSRFIPLNIAIPSLYVIQHQFFFISNEARSLNHAS